MTLLDVGDGHRIHWEVHGEGRPAVVLHGGPGSGCPPFWLEAFDLARYRVVLFDQRGCGRSRPLGELRANTTHHLLADIEALREHLGIERWLVLGGSWGSALGLAYAQRHPDRVSELVLFSVVGAPRRDADWATVQIGRMFPAAWRRFMALVPEGERPVDAYSRLLDDPATADHAAREWCAWEDALISAPPSPRYEDPAFRLTFARIVTHYWRHACWLEDDELLRGADRLAGIPGVLVHGARDVGAPLDFAWELSQTWGELVVVDENHQGGPEMHAAVVGAIDRFAQG
jgi:proline iminopeptidase